MNKPLKICVGTFGLCQSPEGDVLVTIGVSGNSRQRRLYVRRWKRLGYTIKRWHIGGNQNIGRWV